MTTLNTEENKQKLRLEYSQWYGQQCNQDPDSPTTFDMANFWLEKMDLQRQQDFEAIEAWTEENKKSVNWSVKSTQVEKEDLSYNSALSDLLTFLQRL